MVKLPKGHQNTFCGLVFTCPICGGRNCAGRQLKHRRHKHLGKVWADEYYCTTTGQSIRAEDLLVVLKEEHSDPLPTVVKFFLAA